MHEPVIVSIFFIMGLIFIVEALVLINAYFLHERRRYRQNRQNTIQNSQNRQDETQRDTETIV